MSPAHRFRFAWWSQQVVRRWLTVGALAGCASSACARSDSDPAGGRAQNLTAQDGSTGVALCDSYLDQYENCIIPGLPAAQVQRHKTGIVRQRKAWAELAASPAKQESLLRICRSAIATARREFPSCEFVGG
jgi:hypothetical protein